MNYCMDITKDETDFRSHVQEISMTIQNQNGITSLLKFKIPCCQGNAWATMDLAF